MAYTQRVPLSESKVCYARAYDSQDTLIIRYQLYEKTSYKLSYDAEFGYGFFGLKGKPDIDMLYTILWDFIAQAADHCLNVKLLFARDYPDCVGIGYHKTTENNCFQGYYERLRVVCCMNTKTPYFILSKM